MTEAKKILISVPISEIPKLLKNADTSAGKFFKDALLEAVAASLGKMGGS